MNEKSHVVVTGGAGFIGSHLVERLLAENHAVTVIDDLSTGRVENLAAVKSHKDLRIVASKVSDCAELKTIVAGSQFIFHLAAAVGVELVMASSLRTIQTNLRETEVIMDVATACKVPVLLASTSEVYGKSQREAFSEEDDLLIGPPHLSRWSYACSKLMDEFLALGHFREYQTPVIITRLFNTIGPRQTGQYGMVLPRFIEAAKAGKPLRVFGDGKQTRCFCSVNDTVKALVLLKNCPSAMGEIFNIGSTEEVSIVRLAETVIEILQSSSTVEYISYDKACAPGFQDMLRRKPVVEKLARFVGFKPATTLREIIQQTASRG